MKKINPLKWSLLATGLAVSAFAMSGAGLAGNASSEKPAGGTYQAVSALVPLPDHLPGIGSLFVDPATLPAGPFAAYDKTGKLVSTIYMIPLADMNDRKRFGGLKVAGDNAVTVDMMFNAGHPGVDQPHYHIVVWHVEPASADLD